MTKVKDILIGSNNEMKVSDYALADLHVAMAAWIAPEILSGGAVTPASSVYSYGIILWEVYTRKKPFLNKHPIKLVTEILTGLRPEIPLDCPKEYAQLMQSCWDHEAQNRPTWPTVLSQLSNII